MFGNNSNGFEPCENLDSFDNYMQKLDNIQQKTQKPEVRANKQIIEVSSILSQYILDINKQYNNLQKNISSIKF